ncbi:MAG: hypothetical protein ACRCUT_06090, partial [Spirochaetota bacterium]
MIRIQQNEKGFVLSFKGQRVIAHSASRPCLVFGKARGSYRMSHGSFFIKEKIDQTLRCSAFAAGQTDD